MTDAATSSMSYVLGPDDRIAAVDQAWNTFAASQGAGDLTGAQIVGKPLRACIADSNTHEIYALLFGAARKLQRSVAVPFRCDSPGLRRFMTLRADPLPDGSLRISTTLVRAEERPPVALLSPTAPRSDGVLKICGWCKRIPLSSGAWVEVEIALQELGLLEASEMPRLTHGVCPACAASLQAEIDALVTD
jgi:hypothetical protein